MFVQYFLWTREDIFSMFSIDTRFASMSRNIGTFQNEIIITGVFAGTPGIGMFVEEQRIPFHSFAHEDSSVAPFLRRVRTQSSSFSLGGTSGTGADLLHGGSLKDFDPRENQSSGQRWNT
jgi:hypothetical protein